MLSEFGNAGPILAVLDGRFLPLDSFSLNIDRDVGHVSGMSNLNSTPIVKSEQISLKFQTTRKPNYRKTPGSYLTIRNRDERIRFDGVTSVQAPIDISHGNTWTVELTAQNFTIEDI